MEKKIIVTKRFRNNTLRVYQYLLKEFSAKTAFQFLEKLEQRIELIIAHPTIGKPSLKKKNIRSILFTPHNQIFYRYSNNKIEILCLFDMRKNPKKKPY
jgi:plasmid stabilization system protein ParE